MSLFKISTTEEKAMQLERKSIEAELATSVPVTYRGKPRQRRLQNSEPTKQSMVKNSTIKGRCWIWDRAKMKSGYGRIGVKGEVHNAHAIALTIWKGDKPIGCEACHKCDNPSCINPAHLFWGTRRDNVNDCVSKSRFNRPSGENHWMRKRNLHLPFSKLKGVR